MHELSIVTELIKVLHSLIQKEKFLSVMNITIHVGIQQQIDREALETAFRCCVQGTILENTQLKIVEIPILAKCNCCGWEYHAEIDCYVCPKCGLANATILQGNEILIHSIEGEIFNPQDVQLKERESTL